MKNNVQRQNISRQTEAEFGLMCYVDVLCNRWGSVRMCLSGASGGQCSAGALGLSEVHKSKEKRARLGHPVQTSFSVCANGLLTMSSRGKRDHKSAHAKWQVSQRAWVLKRKQCVAVVTAPLNLTSCQVTTQRHAGNTFTSTTTVRLSGKNSTTVQKPQNNGSFPRNDRIAT